MRMLSDELLRLLLRVAGNFKNTFETKFELNYISNWNCKSKSHSHTQHTTVVAVCQCVVKSSH